MPGAERSAMANVIYHELLNRTKEIERYLHNIFRGTPARFRVRSDPEELLSALHGTDRLVLRMANADEMERCGEPTMSTEGQRIRGLFWQTDGDPTVYQCGDCGWLFEFCGCLVVLDLGQMQSLQNKIAVKSGTSMNGR